MTPLVLPSQLIVDASVGRRARSALCRHHHLPRHLPRPCGGGGLVYRGRFPNYPSLHTECLVVTCLLRLSEDCFYPDHSCSETMSVASTSGRVLLGGELRCLAAPVWGRRLRAQRVARPAQRLHVVAPAASLSGKGPAYNKYK